MAPKDISVEVVNRCGDGRIVVRASNIPAVRSLGEVIQDLTERFDAKVVGKREGLIMSFEFAKHVAGDAQSFLRDRVVDLEDAMHQQEFGYWPRGGKRAAR